MFLYLLQYVVCLSNLYTVISSQINSQIVVGVNLYKMFVLTAHKFHTNALKLPQKPFVNPGYFVKLIIGLPGTFLMLIKRKLKVHMWYIA